MNLPHHESEMDVDEEYDGNSVIISNQALTPTSTASSYSTNTNTNTNANTVTVTETETTTTTKTKTMQLDKDMFRQQQQQEISPPVSASSAIMTSSPVQSQMLVPLTDTLQKRPTTSYSPIGMALSMLHSQRTVHSLVPDSQGIFHYHRSTGSFENSRGGMSRNIEGVQGLRQLLSRSNLSMASSTDVQQRAVEQVIRRLALAAPRKYSQRLDTLRSDHARKFKWQDHRVEELQQRETERIRRRVAEEMAIRSAAETSRIEEIEQPDDEWVSDTDNEDTTDMLTWEAYEMTERMQRRAINRRTLGGGITKETKGRRQRPPASAGSSLTQAYARHTGGEAAARRMVSEMGNGDATAILRMLRNGVSVNTRDNIGRTPLHVASSSGNVEAVRLLIHMGAEVNSTDRVGNTPLMLAATSARADVIHPLLEGGADPRIGQGLLSAMTMVRSRLRMLRAQIEQARAVERAATGSLSELIPRAKKRRHQAAAVAKECMDIINMLRVSTTKHIEEEQHESANNLLLGAYDRAATPAADSGTLGTAGEPHIMSNQAVSELDSLSAQLLSMGIAEPDREESAEVSEVDSYRDKGKMADTGDFAERITDPELVIGTVDVASAEMLARDNEDEDQFDQLLAKFSQLLGDD
ncbi:hypothetical protein LPJ66_006211 [Kickxella alabastrina]|uniref:Uncharacterized protein n=1 Tax=Kickxella alabastrina TaxID=61397 RepID=A0ACC1ICJ2_9FUNG|nr:hypothetical protein LPJ66_006211 [Kickxella alabastrina]